MRRKYNWLIVVQKKEGGWVDHMVYPNTKEAFIETCVWLKLQTSIPVVYRMIYRKEKA